MADGDDVNDSKWGHEGWLARLIWTRDVAHWTEKCVWPFGQRVFPISGIFQGWKWIFVHLVLCDLLVDVCDIDVEGKRAEVSHEPSKYM